MPKDDGKEDFWSSDEGLQDLFGGKRPWREAEWTTVDDRLRGGMSRSQLSVAYPTEARFHGQLDIEKLGGAGFASQSSKMDSVGPWDLKAYDGIAVKVQECDDMIYTIVLKDTTSPYKPPKRPSTSSLDESQHEASNNKNPSPSSKRNKKPKSTISWEVSLRFRRHDDATKSPSQQEQAQHPHQQSRPPPFNEVTSPYITSPFVNDGSYYLPPDTQNLNEYEHDDNDHHDNDSSDTSSINSVSTTASACYSSAKMDLSQSVANLRDIPMLSPDIYHPPAHSPPSISALPPPALSQQSLPNPYLSTTTSSSTTSEPLLEDKLDKLKLSSTEHYYTIPLDSPTPRTFFIPFSHFKPFYRGKNITPPPRSLRRNNIKSLSLMVRSHFGEQHGRFSCHINRISAYDVDSFTTRQRGEYVARIVLCTTALLYHPKPHHSSQSQQPSQTDITSSNEEVKGSVMDYVLSKGTATVTDYVSKGTVYMHGVVQNSIMSNYSGFVVPKKGSSLPHLSFLDTRFRRNTVPSTTTTAATATKPPPEDDGSSSMNDKQGSSSSEGAEEQEHLSMSATTDVAAEWALIDDDEIESAKVEAAKEEEQQQLKMDEKQQQEDGGVGMNEKFGFWKALVDRYSGIGAGTGAGEGGVVGTTAADREKSSEVN